MLTINSLKPGTIFLYQNQPYRVLEASHLKKAQSMGMLQVKIKNLVNGNVLATTLKSSEKFEEAEVSYETGMFLYSHRGQFWFAKKDNPKDRFALNESQLGEERWYLKPNMTLRVIYFRGSPIDIELPIKMDFRVTEAPPSIRGDTAQGGTKTVVLETGLKIQVPMFIEAGDIVRVNTQTGEYTERIEKA